MNMHTTSRGFTIIEVMLVLGVTGLMLIGVFVGSNIQITVQRYHDSVTSLQSHLQNEYSQVLNVANDRSPEKCTLGSSDDPSSRGADSNCLILGRLLHGDGDTITSSQVIGVSSGKPDDSLTSGHWSVTALDAADSYLLKWGSGMHIKQTTTTFGSKFSALVIGSPDNGTITTYVDTNDSARTAAQLLAAGPTAQKQLDICVTNSFDLFAGGLLAVRVDAGASGTGSVEVPKQSDNVCAGA